MESRITELKNENKKLTKNFKNYENKAQLPNNDSDISPNSDELENDNISEVDSLEMDEINKLLDEITPNEPNKRKANTVPEIIFQISNNLFGRSLVNHTNLLIKKRKCTMSY